MLSWPAKSKYLYTSFQWLTIPFLFQSNQRNPSRTESVSKLNGARCDSSNHVLHSLPTKKRTQRSGQSVSIIVLSDSIMHSKAGKTLNCQVSGRVTRLYTWSYIALYFTLLLGHKTPLILLDNLNDLMLRLLKLCGVSNLKCEKRQTGNSVCLIPCEDLPVL